MVIAQAEDLGHHREPRLEFGEALRPDRDRLIRARPGDLEAAVVREQTAHAGEVAVHAGPVQFPHDALCCGPFRHSELLES